MIPVPNDLNIDDAAQWLSQGVVYLLQGTEYIPIYVQDIQRGIDASGNFIPNVRYNILDGTRGGARQTSIIRNMFVSWPRCGAVNIHNTPVATYVEREVARQYKRAFFGRMLTLNTPREWEFTQGMTNAQVNALSRTSQEVLYSCFFPNYPSPADALDLLARGTKFSVALNPRVIAMRSAEGGHLFYYNGVLAAAETGGVLRPLDDPFYLQRINKVFDGRFVCQEPI